MSHLLLGIRRMITNPRLLEKERVEHRMMIRVKAAFPLIIFLLHVAVLCAGCNNAGIPEDREGENMQTHTVTCDNEVNDIQMPQQIDEIEPVLFPFQDLDSKKWGYMDGEGNVRIVPQYDSVSFYNAMNVARVRIGENWGFIDKLNCIRIPIVHEGVYLSDESLLILEKENRGVSHGGETYIYINEFGEEFLRLKDYYDASTFQEGFAFVSEDEGLNSGFVDTTGNFVIDLQYGFFGPFSCGLAFFSKEFGEDCRYGFIDSSNTVVIQDIYEEAKSFSENLAPVKKGGLWGYIDRENNTIIEYRFDDACSFSEGVAVVMENNLWGVIDHAGEYILTPQYPNLSDSYNGLFMVRKGFFDFDYYM